MKFETFMLTLFSQNCSLSRRYHKKLKLKKKAKKPKKNPAGL